MALAISSHFCVFGSEYDSCYAASLEWQRSRSLGPRGGSNASLAYATLSCAMLPYQRSPRNRTLQQIVSSGPPLCWSDPARENKSAENFFGTAASFSSPAPSFGEDKTTGSFDG